MPAMKKPPPPIESRDWLFAREAAELAHVSERIIADACARGILPCRELKGPQQRRISKRALSRWIEGDGGLGVLAVDAILTCMRPGTRARVRDDRLEIAEDETARWIDVGIIATGDAAPAELRCRRHNEQQGRA